ncbi:MAG: hypothetical protein LC099_09145 [Anaerolineales bacterium]|nr:hypothetical protein [Anaerolineales bacterium]
MEFVSTRKFLQIWLWALTVVGALAIWQTAARAQELEIALLRSKWIGLIFVFAIAALIALWLSFSSALQRLADKIDSLTERPLNFVRAAFCVALILVGFVSVWVFRFVVFGSFLPQATPILWIFLWASLLQTFGLKFLLKKNWQTTFAFVLLTQGLLYQTSGIFSAVSADPFSIGYSEAGRHYYASLFFAQKLYGIKTAFPFLHPSRYFLLSLPFLIDGLPLWAHRLWQALLWFVLTLGAALSLARFARVRGWARFFLVAWAFLFFFQGAVYYHLQAMTILILAGVSSNAPRRSWIFILLASLWAGVSRVNWFPVPAMLAIAIYLLETPLNKKGWGYWRTPLFWGASGFIAALFSQWLYIQISGNADAAAFASSFTSDLIWTRLLPNETYPLGILLGSLLVSAPLFFALRQIIRGNINALHPLRWLTLGGLLTVLFVGGAVVSVKIGGGGDLHNMDAFLVLLATLSAAFWAKRVAAEENASAQWNALGWNAAFLALLIPLGFALGQMGFPSAYDSKIADADIRQLQAALQNDGEILFVTERQLLTFGYLKNVALTTDYEQSELMEMAMSHNRPYLEKYYADLQNRRFALIVAESQKFAVRTDGAFAEEDAAWVRYVGAPLLCNYEPILSLTSNNLQIYEPRSAAAPCKDPFNR